MKTFGTVDDYIKSYPPKIAKQLKTLRAIVKKKVPEARETISYGMPAYKLSRVVVYFAGYEHHIGFYPHSNAITVFKKELGKYKTSKGAIQFPIDEKLPIKLIERIIAFRLKEDAGRNKEFFKQHKTGVCSRGHVWKKSKDKSVCPKCWSGYYGVSR